MSLNQKFLSVKIPKPRAWGREKEFAKIKEDIENFIKTSKGSILYISGVPGSGKTYTVELVIKEIIRENKYENFGNNKTLSISFLNCSELKNKRDIFSKTIKNFNECNNSINKADKANLQILRSHICNCHNLHLIVIDEVDFILTKNEMHLYNLLELTYIENSLVMLIFLSNTLGSLSTKLESRIGKNRMEFKPYTSTQLYNIAVNINESNKNIANCKENSKQPDNKKILNFIGKKVASGTGDVRKLKLLLSNSYEHIKEANDKIKKINESLMCRFIKYLNYNQKIILGSLLNIENEALARCYNSYKSCCKLNETNNIINFYEFKENIIIMSELGFYKLNKAFNKVSVTFPREEIEEAVKEDKILNAIVKRTPDISD